MKKFMFVFIFGILSLLAWSSASLFAPATAKETDSINTQTIALDEDVTNFYLIYDEDGNFLLHRREVQISDQIITTEFKVYEIIEIDSENKKAIATLISVLAPPKINTTDLSKNRNRSTGEKLIGMYMTHNAESYLIGDGYDSIYGEGGIHDVAKKLRDELEKLGSEVILDETLHLPHDSSAYYRSGITASRIYENEPDALFDIHRDAGGRSLYLNDKEDIYKSKVMIVIGQSNGSKERNLEFALYLLAVADAIMPNLFLDIYYASGHYNQSISPKSLLFECGGHTMEKEYVLNAMPDLAKVIYTTLYNTYINEETGELTIGVEPTPEEDNNNGSSSEDDSTSEETPAPTPPVDDSVNGSTDSGDNLTDGDKNINDYLDDKANESSNTGLAILIVIIITVAVIVGARLVNKFYDSKNKR